MTECYALEAVARDGPLTINEIAARLSVDKATASRAVQSLAQKRYARSRVHPDDSRALQVRATAAGERLYERIHAAGRALHLRILEGISRGGTPGGHGAPPSDRRRRNAVRELRELPAMLIRIPPPWSLPEREATPEKVFDNRRAFIRKLGLAVIGTGAAALASGAPRESVVENACRKGAGRASPRPTSIPLAATRSTC